MRTPNPLSELRQALKVTQVELAAMLGCSQAHVSRLEKGRNCLDIRQYAILQKRCAEAGIAMPPMTALLGSFPATATHESAA